MKPSTQQNSAFFELSLEKDIDAILVGGFNPSEKTRGENNKTFETTT